MSNLAKMFHALGRHVDALNLQNRVLELRQSILPKHHPDIGSCYAKCAVAISFIDFVLLLSLHSQV
jgi:hypothetical protein